jgi:hypothetical protein
MKTKPIFHLFAGCLLLCSVVTLILLFPAARASAKSQGYDAFKVGDRVEVSLSGLVEDKYYEACVVKEVLETGYIVTCENTSKTEFFVKPEWVRRPKAAAQAPAPPAPERVTPAPKDEKPLQPIPPEPVAAADFRAGDIVEATISGLPGNEHYETCVITEVLDAKYRVVCSGIEYVVLAPWVRPRTNAKLALDRNNLKEAPSNAPCDTTPPGPPVKNTDNFSATLAKRIIYDNTAETINGSLTAPLKTGVTFLSFTIGNSFVNTIANGRLLNDAAPLNATVYQLKSKHVICAEHATVTKKSEVETAYMCFRYRGMEWVCAETGTFKFTPLNY